MKVSPRTTERGAVAGVVRSPKHSRPRKGKRLTRKSVTKMLAVMTEQSPDSNKDPVEAFLSTGRTGRRNALADIRGEHASTTTSNLPEYLEKLTTDDNPPESTEEQSSSTLPTKEDSADKSADSSMKGPSLGQS